jgi:hypothetical protein
MGKKYNLAFDPSFNLIMINGNKGLKTSKIRLNEKRARSSQIIAIIK